MYIYTCPSFVSDMYFVMRFCSQQSLDGLVRTTSGIPEIRMLVAMNSNKWVF